MSLEPDEKLYKKIEKIKIKLGESQPIDKEENRELKLNEDDFAQEDEKEIFSPDSIPLEEQHSMRSNDSDEFSRSEDIKQMLIDMKANPIPKPKKVKILAGRELIEYLRKEKLGIS